MSVRLKKFDPSNMADDKVVVIIGKRGTGKSTLVTDILWHKKHLPVGVVMSATEDGNHYYKQYVPDLFVHGDFNKDVIQKVIDRQKTLVSNGVQKPKSSAFLLLDDCMYDRKFFRETCIRQIFMNGRHWHIFLAVTMQYMMDMSPDLRANVDYVFILRENIRANREKLWKAFAGIFPKLQDFCDVMDACTENFECLVIDNTSKSNSIEECVFWYKARVRTGFKIGSKAMWQEHARRYNTSLAPQGVKPVERKKLQVNKVTIN